MTWLIGTLLTSFAANCSPAQESSSGAAGPKAAEGETSTADDAPTYPSLVAIRAGAEACADAFNKADASAIANLGTKDEAPVLIHFRKDFAEQWLLVRLNNPDRKAAAEPSS